uniref:Uncharacterized protein n=1 Tax=Cucumis melo TaxID=3656 RepID=A0A9I9EIM5_CUCME
MCPLYPELEQMRISFFLDRSLLCLLFFVLIIKAIVSIEGEAPILLCLSSCLVSEKTLFIIGSGLLNRTSAWIWEKDSFKPIRKIMRNSALRNSSIFFIPLHVYSSTRRYSSSCYHIMVIFAQYASIDKVPCDVVTSISMTPLINPSLFLPKRAKQSPYFRMNYRLESLSGATNRDSSELQDQWMSNPRLELLSFS